jgi:hypothetical protein
MAATWLPFLAYAWRRDRAVGLVAPAVLLVRSLALGCGLAWGLLRARGLARLRPPARE